MITKFLDNFRWVFLTLICCLIFAELKAQELEEEHLKSFYAISSLKFYLEQLVLRAASPPSEKVYFSEANINHLWEQASLDLSIFSSIQEAQNQYDESMQLSDPALRNQKWKKIYKTLQDVWYQLNAYIPRSELLTDKYLYFNKKNSSYPNFDDNSFISRSMRRKMRAYLLPLNHPLINCLDSIFNGLHVIQNEFSFAEAGFETLYHQLKSKIRVARHPYLPGYLIKAYLDNDKVPGHLGWERLLERCKGADNIRRLIKEKKLIHFSVPDKWIYPLPCFQIPSHQMQPVILLVTDMNIVSLEESFEIWRNKITHRHLEELYCILSHGFASAYLPFNIPYTKDGKFACIDTEYSKREVRYHILKPYLSPEMLLYWEKLIKMGGKI